MSELSEGMADLFGSASLAGLSSAESFLSPADEAELIANIDDAGLSPFRFQGWLGKRLTRSYGHGYDFESGRFSIGEPVPDWLLPIRDRAAGFADVAPERFSQALLIRYGPGAGIGWHRDRPQFERVVGISLGAAAMMHFRRRLENGFQRFRFPLTPRSIYHLSGEARHEWEHSIPDMSDTRWSITFRSLSDTGVKALRAASSPAEAP